MYQKIYHIFLRQVIQKNLVETTKDITFSFKEGEMLLDIPKLFIQYDGEDLEVQEKDEKGKLIYSVLTDDPLTIGRTINRYPQEATYIQLRSCDTFDFYPTLDLEALKRLTKLVNHEEGDYVECAFISYLNNSVHSIGSVGYRSSETLAMRWAENKYLLLTHFNSEYHTAYELYAPVYVPLIPLFRVTIHDMDWIPDITVRPAIEIYEEGGKDFNIEKSLKELLELDPLATLQQWTWKIITNRIYLRHYELYD